ncbi:hypothetical protein [Bacillus massilinigeriensis]|uniref:hypothetical protein n=1 Tax=Bacillus massilionigeriensis TaxID=1805475 RepID=UPI00156D911E|nr:hypothetical protein [Bacillus massilionigeriensis]
MDKRGSGQQSQYYYDEQGAGHVSQQIVDAYNSGVIDSESGQFDMDKFNRNQSIEE